MSYPKNPHSKPKPLVAVIGASAAKKPIVEIAEQVGAAICAEGWHLLTGGGAGVMEAACRGFRKTAKEGCGLTVGILPFDDATFANSYVDIPIPTGIGIARNAIIARSASGLIAVGGCAGTLSEIALAWQMGRPIAAVVASGGWSKKMAGVAIDKRRSDSVFSARNAQEAVDYLKNKISVS